MNGLYILFYTRDKFYSGSIVQNLISKSHFSKMTYVIVNLFITVKPFISVFFISNIAQ